MVVLGHKGGKGGQRRWQRSRKGLWQERERSGSAGKRRQENDDPKACHCCGELGSTGHGFVYSDADAHAVYYAAWSSTHRERGVSFAIAVGEWGDDSTSRDRICFGLEAHEGENDIQFRFIDPSESPWPETDLMGAMVGRSEALLSGKKTDILRIAEKVIQEHPAIRSFLRNCAGGNSATGNS